MKTRLIASLTTAAVAATMILGASLPASAGPGDWEEHDRVDGLTTPLGVAVHEATTRLYVTEPDAEAITILDADTLEVIDQVTFPGMTPLHIVVEQSTGVVYFVDQVAWQIVRWDPAELPADADTYVVGDEILALSLAVDGDGVTWGVQWTVDDGSNGWLQSADLDLAAVTSLDLGAGVRPEGFASMVAQDDSWPTPLPVAIITDSANDTLILAVPGFVVAPLPLGGVQPVDIALVLEGEEGIIVIASFGDDSVLILDTVNVIATAVGVESGPIDVDLPSSAGPVFVVSLSGFVSVIPTPYSDVEWVIPLGSPALFGAYSSSLNRYFVALPDTGEVVSIAFTPASTGGGTGGLADTGTDGAPGVAALALALILIGGVLSAVRRQRGIATSH